ncbi:MAG: ATP-binding protein [Solirubrobacterales bacterium]
MNPSLANRLRSGFAITFALLAGVAVIGAARLIDLREAHESQTAASYELQILAERMRQAFGDQRQALRDLEVTPAGSRARFALASSVFSRAGADAVPLAGGDAASRRLSELLRAHDRWQELVAAPQLQGRPPASLLGPRLTRRVLVTEAALEAGEVAHRAELRSSVSAEVRRTAVIGVAILIGCGVIAAILFNGLITSIRSPLERLGAAAGRLAGGDLRARVVVDGPAEAAALGNAFNEMADELQSAYRHLEESRQRLAVTLESLSDGVITVDELGVVTDANPAARRLLPWADVGAPIRELLEGSMPSRELERLLAGREPEEVHIGEGDSILAVTASKLGAEAGGTVISVRDISERARLERLKDEFVLTASHELRSPLTSIHGFAELLMMEKGRLSPRQTETVEIILDNTRHLVRLLNDLLDLARSDAGRLEIRPVPTDLGPLVEEAVRTMRAQTEASSQHLDFDVEPGLPQVLAEPDRIRQVLTNLITNAHEYCPGGANISVSAMRGADGVVLAVSDDGPGIAPKHRDHIFERFVRGEAGLTQRVGGTGLGLAVSRSLIELHGGSLEVSSSPGQGSTFRIVLPAFESSGAEPAPTALGSR